jgi:hypothetical protein
VVVHLVLFRPKPNISDADRASMFDALGAAATDIPSVRRFQIGARVTHGAAYEALMAHEFPFAAIVEFDNLAGLQAYLQHPRHDQLGRLFYQLQDAALAYDYEVGGLDAGGHPKANLKR